jgi:hypothetical protein
MSQIRETGFYRIVSRTIAGHVDGRAIDDHGRAGVGLLLSLN